MKALTVKQPWGSLICLGIKPIENRAWKCPEKYIGQRVLIHTSSSQGKKFNINLTDEQMIAAFGSIAMDSIAGNFEFGAIIGSAIILDCVINHPSIWAEKQHCLLKTPCKDLAKRPNCWDGCMHFSKPIYNWVLANPILFPEPIPAKGKLGFWDYPNILAEPEEEGGELFCQCHIPVKEENQVMPLGGGHFMCRYCGGKWYK